MKSLAFLLGLTSICAVLVVVSLWKVVGLDSQLRNSDSAALQESLKRVQAELATAKELAPALGEYMTTIQLHAGKLWFAAKASNWELAAYELHELEETMKTVTKLNVEKTA